MGDSVRDVGAAGVPGHCPEDPQTHFQAEHPRKLLTSQLEEQKLRVVEKESGIKNQIPGSSVSAL